MTTRVILLLLAAMALLFIFQEKRTDDCAVYKDKYEQCQREGAYP